ncbi:hypothetical protein SLS58_010784 [Diplodia intermedia]|uniref:Uncharacterized protein n=1 Tax=Diplodia intermedia TaxID=856260 RepID=A0ABR3T3V3_9PEZI
MSSNNSNIGPLTTTFTPASSECYSSLGFHTELGGLPGVVLGLPGQQQYDSCLPSSYDWAQSRFYSPGICPSGHTVDCSAPITSNDVVTTIGTCCPTSWTCRGGRNEAPTIKYACKSALTAGDTMTVSSYESSSGGTDVTTGRATLTATEGAVAFAYGVIVRRQATDPTWATAAIVAASTAPSTSAEATDAASGGSVERGGEAAGLSTGAKAGIGVGVGVGALGIIAAVCFGALLLRTKRRSRRPARAELEQTDPPKELPDNSVMEMHGNGKDPTRSPAELPSTY